MQPQLCIILLLACFADAWSQTSATLRAAGAAAGIHMGSQFKYTAIFNATPGSGIYKHTHTAQYSLSTVGNECKWAATHPARETFTLDACVASLGYASGAGQAFRGHNLCWGNDNPPWLLSISSESELRSVLSEHVTKVMRGAPGALAWDVVNEACNSNPHNATDFFKPASPWYPALPDYVDVAFRAARAADPKPLLFYNDYGAEEAGSSKGDLVYAMLKSMVARGVPIDGVGLQMHVGTPQGGQRTAGINATRVSWNIARLGRLGLQVHITEMDVKCLDPCSKAQQAAQAKVYADVLRACLENKGVCTSFETWGFTDALTWLTGPRCPTESCHPLPFDQLYQPKPAVAAMLEVLKEFKQA